MNFCSTCGQQNDTAARYCPGCGAPSVGPSYAQLTQTAPQRPVASSGQKPCRRCAHPVSWSVGRCPNCGIRLPGLRKYARRLIYWAPVLLLLSAFGGVYDQVAGSRLSAQRVEREVGQALTTRLRVPVAVRCPDGDEPLQKGRISDCVATAPGEQPYVVRITQDDSSGHFTWELTDQHPS